MSQTTIDHTPPDADQAEFDADMAYMRELLAAIETQGALQPLDAEQSRQLDDAIVEATYLGYEPHWIEGDRTESPEEGRSAARHTWPVRRLIVGLIAAMILIGCGICWSARADAAPSVGCETIAAPGLLTWGQKRTICDTPRRADGSWTRARQYWTPAHYVPVSCYRWNCTGGYDVGDTVSRYEEYVVFDSNVLPDEPGWLPTGSVVIR